MGRASLDVDTAVARRYSAAAREPEASLCCPTRYDPGLLDPIPQEVWERDYGCGNPFRSLTVRAFKGKEGPCLDQKHAVVYSGPFRQVIDDDGRVLRRGVRTAVCAKTYPIYERAPYRAHLALPPHELVPIDDAPPFPCADGAIVRDPRAGKGDDYRATTEASSCGPDGCC